MQVGEGFEPFRVRVTADYSLPPLAAREPHRFDGADYRNRTATY